MTRQIPACSGVPAPSGVSLPAGARRRQLPEKGRDQSQLTRPGVQPDVASALGAEAGVRWNSGFPNLTLALFLPKTDKGDVVQQGS